MAAGRIHTHSLKHRALAVVLVMGTKAAAADKPPSALDHPFSSTLLSPFISIPIWPLPAACSKLSIESFAKSYSPVPPT